ncbi:MAG TPA: energy transducer TonB [Chitinophagales bacterium]|nr:energy transducer TonB [Chitinophagales bacterium]
MKYILICALFLGINSISAQNTNRTSSPSSEYNLISPEFPGGAAAKNHFLSTNVQYPIVAKENKIQGVVELRFIVEIDGTLTHFEILKDPGGGLGEEALRVYKLMPKWIPGDLYNQPARVPITESLNFRLSPSKSFKK